MIGAQLCVVTVIAKWVLLGKIKDGHHASGLSWNLRIFVVELGWKISYALFMNYFIDCTILSIVMYNLCGANVSYKTGIRFLQNMSPIHADLITIKNGVNLSNANLHPADPKDNKVLRNIVLE